MHATHTRPAWLDMTKVASVEASSEHGRHPIEDAFSSTGDGWRASESGEQVIRVVFRSPRTLGRIRIVFNETAHDRTQEFTLGWSAHRGETHRLLVRQQVTFGRSGTTREQQEYDVELRDVSQLELRIVPDIERREAVATLTEFRMA